MKITKIEKKKRLYLMELDTDEKLYITEDTIVRFMLSKDKVITEERLEEIKRFAQLSYGKNLAFYYLSFKQRTQKEVSDYLLKYDIDSLLIPTIIDQLLEEKWLDDQKLVESLIEQNFSSGDKGPYILKEKCRRRGISKSDFEAIIDAKDYALLCQKIAQKLLKKYENKLPQKALRDKIIQSLSAKGFSFQDAKLAYQQLDIETDEESQMELLYKALDKQFPKYRKKYEGYALKQHLIQYLARKGFDFDEIHAALRDYL